ncbi:MAG: sugar ABC transporter permease [Sphaerochaeta sp.]|jgi:multiple sugar transport system permease protein|uniref:carbohydrate ABC transporter permease n=1 Tax=unclassified Sphaerochaeta TaxID=2637943 RepID=UPI000EB97CD1|nr:MULTISPECIES: sugar ABC transporter permease [unclassified Sphaerochaeta]MCK9598522.1 sugar ABC transporter permease [Sphaerochaeta sp.]MDX9824815.1 sugar ABC transporter permease [Sphaerochaeta sp.]MEA4864539.1 sugar ABC transporter permease [Sphaerochaeta sp.]HAP57519.1 ABC transporter permease [Sphaerochaeta sp.]HPE93754.1 sugar ABC transporter permease [Sphaerochaeta sp.]
MVDLHRKKIWKENLGSYAFLVPWLLGFLGLTLYPMLYSLYLSFTKFNIRTPPEWIGLRNYLVMFVGTDSLPKDERFLNSVMVTVKFVFISVPLKLVFALAVAMLMNKKLKLIGLYRALYYIPTLLGGSVAIAVLWRRLFAGDGLINMILSNVFGMQNLPAWISNPKYSLYTLILLAVWQFGSPMIIFLAGLQQIPREYYEASSVDGAGRVRQFFAITLPSLSPIIFFNFVMQMISAFQSFTQAFIVSGGSGGPLDSTMFYSLYLYIKGFGFSEMGYAAAMAWVLLIIIAGLTALSFKVSGNLVTYGSGE